MIFDLLFESDNFKITTTVQASEGFQKFIDKSSSVKDKFNDEVFAYIPKETHVLAASAISTEKLHAYLKTYPEYGQIEAMMLLQNQDTYKRLLFAN